MSQVHPVAQGTIRRSYTPNLEGALVTVVMEFLSDEDGGKLSVRATPPYGKLHFYEQILQVPTYVTLSESFAGMGFIPHPKKQG